MIKIQSVPKNLTKPHKEAVALLKQLIQQASFSRAEEATAAILAKFLRGRGVSIHRQDHNIWAWNRHRQDGLPTILLNSHHDTIRPVKSWTRDPFAAEVEGDRLFGLGSNDAGASLVALIATFLHFYRQEDLPFNLVLAATAEEEISGPKGIASILPALGKIDGAIVGEPTQMRMAVAERGLMVIDGEAIGQAGHAAREEGINAIYLAMEDIWRLRNYRFEKNSEFLGPVKVSLTQIEAGTQHNVVPDCCRFVLDVRSNEQYSNQQIFEQLQGLVQSNLKARSFRLNASGIALDHPLVKSGQALGLSTFGSPTLDRKSVV